MAPLRGTLKGTRGETSRLGHKEITATLSTWEGRVTTTLRKDGTFTVELAPVDGPARIVATGNANVGEPDVPAWVNGGEVVMFPEDHLLDPQPATTRRERRDRRDADRKASEAEFVRGYHAAEVDHEDGATLQGIIERAESLIPDTPVSQRPYLVGRVAYCCEALRDLSG